MKFEDDRDRQRSARKGHDEGQAIRIAIAKAKEWAERRRIVVATLIAPQESQSIESSSEAQVRGEDFRQSCATLEQVS